MLPCRDEEARHLGPAHSEGPDGVATPGPHGQQSAAGVAAGGVRHDAEAGDAGALEADHRWGRAVPPGPGEGPPPV